MTPNEKAKILADIERLRALLDAEEVEVAEEPEPLSEVDLWGPFWGPYLAALNLRHVPVVPLLSIDADAEVFGDLALNNSGFFVNSRQLEIRDAMLEGAYIDLWRNEKPGEDRVRKYSRTELQRFAIYGARHSIILNSELLMTPPGYVPAGADLHFMADQYNAYANTKLMLKIGSGKCVFSAVWDEFTINPDAEHAHQRIVPVPGSLYPGVKFVHGGPLFGKETFQAMLLRGAEGYLESFGNGHKLQRAIMTTGRVALRRLDREARRMRTEEQKAAFEVIHPGWPPFV